MRKIGILVGERGDWKFFKDIFDDLNRHYQMTTFKEKTYRTPLLYGRLNRWAFRKGIRSILRQSDLCFFEWASELLVTASRMPKYCPIVTRLHSYELYAWAPKVNWDNVDKVILVSQAMREKFSCLYPDHAHKTEVVYNAKPLDQFKPLPRIFNHDLGMLGAINPRKRIYETVIMLHDLKRQGCRAHLHIGGERLNAPDFDEYYVAIRRLVEKLGLQDNVTIYGHITNSADWLHGIDVFISNSYWEGHQVALIEAMASGCYCLSHFWDGAEELLPPENLYSNETELQQKIIAYCSMSEMERHRCQEQMRAIACEKFDVKKQRVRIREIIEAVAYNALRKSNCRL